MLTIQVSRRKFCDISHYPFLKKIDIIEYRVATPVFNKNLPGICGCHQPALQPFGLLERVRPEF
jgi:hypothetical protein